MLLFITLFEEMPWLCRICFKKSHHKIICVSRTLCRNIPFSREGRIQLRVEGYSHLFAVSLNCKLRSLVTGTFFFRSFDILTAADKFRKINLLNLVLHFSKYLIDTHNKNCRCRKISRNGSAIENMTNI